MRYDLPGANYSPPVFPVLAILAIRESAKPGATDPFLAAKFARPYFATCLGLNVILTVLIVARLLHMRKQMSGLGKQHSRVFTSMAGLIIESALPFTLVSVFAIVTITYEKNQHIQFSSAFAVPLVGGVLVRDNASQLCCTSDSVHSGSFRCAFFCGLPSVAGSSQLRNKDPPRPVSTSGHHRGRSRQCSHQ